MPVVVERICTHPMPAPRPNGRTVRNRQAPNLRTLLRRNNRMDHPSPDRIMEVGLGFWPAKVLLSAVELGLFTKLGSGALTGPELRAALGLHPRADPDFFDALVALRFLDRDGTSPQARYRNTAEA